MKNKVITIITILTFIISISFASASLSLGPGKLYFNLNPGEKSCQKVIISSSDYVGLIKIRDIWANRYNEQGNFNLYTAKTSDLGITISYTPQIDNFQDSQEVEVCITVSNSGSYKGALIFTPTTTTNVNVEVGTWLLINFPDAQTNSATTSTTPTTTATPITTSISQVAETETDRETTTTPTTTETETQTEETNSITGAVTGGGSKIGIWIIGFICVIVVIAGFMLYKRWRRRRWEMGY